ncbi:methyl-accepting chemotaxis protein [Burkholderia vietnamiensis]|uniref:methyl-accepting chemotaxis protein n=1 Tax=Burkholderia vietnamiensis TaxID=60552 RepID=UPI0007572546|nr:methyl-accepting chemotaxis protein [Burkholderia vietnamiensis]KVF79844.1 chemotaxis protein [Burkholderia vietnamiensis]KVF87275.1 chemotaxis protein [Burkholderia vietnamiensis]KVF90659.1 chemotaxis protein [Burkholderia vietnamiensis]KVF97576.1 chemotaxis protein [Burkholderia vietnamiensis]MDN7665703.1 methyl-accepting chemotaxis protein [Burkholderia vietnamiensis]
MGSMTVGRKLAAAFGIVVLIALIGSAISIVNFLKLNQANGWNVHSYQVLRANDDMLTSMVNMETGVRGYVAAGDDRFLEPYKAGLRQFAKSFDVVRSLTSDNAAQQRRLETLRDMHRKVAEVDDKLIAMRRDVNAGTQPANVLIDYFKQGDDKQFMDRYRAVAAELNEAEQSLLDQRSGEVASLTALTKVTLAAAGVITVILSIVLGTVITRGIMRSLGGEPADAAAVAGRIAEGNLEAPVPVAPNDRGSLMASLESMRRQLSGIVSEIQSTAESITTSAGEIAQGNLDLSQRTEEQAASLEETAASMEQLTATVRQNTENAKQANALAGSACEVAMRGGEVVNEVVDSMRAISSSSGKVAEIIAVIEGIAFQTNILALNAAVEAARAGEQGRGFAVVAGEVRTLAQRSANAAKEIKDLITGSVESVALGSQQVERAGSTMSDIVQSVRRVTDIMNEIASASDEQGTGIEQVNVAVGQMDSVTQQNAALVEQASAAAQAMAQQATTLRDVVGVFRIGRVAAR